MDEMIVVIFVILVLLTGVILLLMEENSMLRRINAEQRELIKILRDREEDENDREKF